MAHAGRDLHWALVVPWLQEVQKILVDQDYLADRHFQTGQVAQFGRDHRETLEVRMVLGVQTVLVVQELPPLQGRLEIRQVQELLEAQLIP